MKRATRADVARLAGVSPATVSHVLNGRAEELKFSAATAQRVRDAALELGYIPRAAARAFRYQTSQIIALITGRDPATLKLPVFSEVLVAAIATARDADYFVLPIVVPPTIDDPVTMVREAIANVEIAGVLCDGEPHLHVLGELFAAADIPVAWIAPETPAEQVLGTISLGVDTAAGIHTLLDRIVIDQVNNPLFIAGPDNFNDFTDLLEQRFGRCTRQRSASWLSHAGYEIAREHLQRYAQGVGVLYDFVLCGNDLLASGYLTALEQADIAVPETVQVIGFGGHDRDMQGGRLTTVHWPLATVARMATTTVIDAIASRRQADADSQSQQPGRQFPSPLAKVSLVPAQPVLARTTMPRNYQYLTTKQPTTS
ncbi:LacI family DNA-binding transcriptional regulator [Corynebacterium choanae]|uniref:Ribose operon repressor n=1 Tax=Corynebacterium choanae TaxID=1862358 RepID=A0A3G6J665_9CORY|nr:LacI family DNA-binding transcriptional regulator [Corynebacterium choanae]AZA13312.1 Ribose operon repressor [Corynebacterium choanae]